jgi:hypothetical protein
MVCTLLLVFIFATLPVDSVASAAESPPDAPEINALVAGLPDEQVRQLLIKELQKSPVHEQAVLRDNIAGPGMIFGRMLSSLSRKADTSEHKTRQLLTGVPLLFPDLYRVFLTL